jgi:hypothetical protein
MVGGIVPQGVAWLLAGLLGRETTKPPSEILDGHDLVLRTASGSGSMPFR